MKHFYLINILIALLLYSFTSEQKAQIVDKIILADTIQFNIHSYGCFSSADNNILISKNADKTYLLYYSNSKNEISKVAIDFKKVKKLGTTFKSEMKKNYKGGCTSGTFFELSSKTDTVYFGYNICGKRHTPVEHFGKVLDLKLDIH